MLEAYDLLPTSFQELVRSFESLDRLYCFLTKRKLAVTFTRLKRLYEEFNKLNFSTAQDACSKDEIVDNRIDGNVSIDRNGGTGAEDHPRSRPPISVDIVAAAAAVFNINYLCHICSLCPEHIQIRVYTLDEENHSMMKQHAPSPVNYYNNNNNNNNNNNDDDLIELELYFPVNASASVHHSKQRRKTVIDKLFQILVQHYHSEYMKGSPCDFEKTMKIVRKKGWSSIDINQLDCIQLLPPLQMDVLLNVNRYIRQSNRSPSTVAAPSSVTSLPILHTCSLESTDIRPISIDHMGGAKAVLEYLKSLPSYRDQLKHVEHCVSREAVYGEIAPPAINSLLMDRLKKVLRLDKGLYRHQVKGIDALRQGRHVMVSTSTASGKSLIYNIPIIEAMLNDSHATALYIFPTKALAQDQLRSLLTLLQDTDGVSLPVRVAACDGDTGIYERSDIQGNNNNNRDDHHINSATTSYPINIILTNPDMLHCTMLPDHANWSRIYKNLRYVVIDESHMYGGIFGANVAAVLRRLVRICLHYQRNVPQFICCSATIANPLSHMLKLIPLDCLKPNDDGDGGDAVVVVDSSDDGAPQCERYISYHLY